MCNGIYVYIKKDVRMILLMFKGLPASGKSTAARGLVKSSSGWVRVNKDDIRRSIPDYKFSKSAEKVVLERENTLIREALSAGKSVVVDNTHLRSFHEDRLRQLADEYGARFAIDASFLEVPLVECIRRDLLRPTAERVGADRIYEMWVNYACGGRVWLAPQNSDLPEAVICDIDGTVTLGPNDRSPYDWSKVYNDMPNHFVISAVTAVAKGKHLLFVSGRSEVCRQATIKWLSTHFDRNYDLYMRPEDQLKERDSVIKLDLYRQHIEDHFFVKAVFDDRYQVVSEVWRPLGLPLFQIGNTTGRF